MTSDSRPLTSDLCPFNFAAITFEDEIFERVAYASTKGDWRIQEEETNSGEENDTETEENTEDETIDLTDDDSQEEVHDEEDMESEETEEIEQENEEELEESDFNEATTDEDQREDTGVDEIIITKDSLEKDHSTFPRSACTPGSRCVLPIGTGPQSLGPFQTLLSPQMNYANEPMQNKKEKVKGKKAYITSISPQDKEQDYIEFYNPGYDTVALEDFQLLIKEKKHQLDEIEVSGKNSFRLEINLPNTKGEISFSKDNFSQKIQYAESKKDQIYTLDVNTGLWNWEEKGKKEKVKGKKVERKKRERILGVQDENICKDKSLCLSDINCTEETSLCPSQDSTQTPNSGLFQTAEASGDEINMRTKILKPSSIWYFIGIFLCMILILWSRKIISILNKDTTHVSSPMSHISPLDLSSASIQNE